MPRSLLGPLAAVASANVEFPRGGAYIGMSNDVEGRVEHEMAQAQIIPGREAIARKRRKKGG